MSHGPWNQQKKCGDYGSQSPASDENAFDAQACHRRRDKQRQHAREGHQRQQEPDAGFGQPELVEKQDVDRAEEGELNEDRIGAVVGDAPVQAAYLLGL